MSFRQVAELVFAIAIPANMAYYLDIFLTS